MINALHIISYQLILDLNYPANIEYMMTIVYRLINADVIDPDWSTSLVYNFEPDINYVETARKLDHQTYLNNQLYRVGFETFNPVYNLGGIYVFLILVAIQVFIYGGMFVGYILYNKFKL